MERRVYLWRGRSFIFADLVILPILDVYRNYYGWRVMGYILVTFYVTMAAGHMVEFLFEAPGMIPRNRTVIAISEGCRGTIPVSSIASSSSWLPSW
jgi:hypothetical protein